MNKNIIVGGIVLIAAIGVLIWSGSQEAPITYFNNTNIACLANGHQSIESHIHPELSIVVDGEDERIPADIGINHLCMSEIHTHDSSGRVHVETFDSERLVGMTLADFFTVWDRDVEREGYDLEIIQDGEVKDSVSDVPMIDNSVIELNYTSVSQG